MIAFNDSINVFHNCGKFLNSRVDLSNRRGPLTKQLLSDLTAGGEITVPVCLRVELHYTPVMVMNRMLLAVVVLVSGWL